MKDKYNVLVLPAGSSIAIAAIKMLKKDKKINIVSADVNKLAPGLYLSDERYLIPKFFDKDFYKKLEKIVEKSEINVIIPALDPILYDFSKNISYFEKLGVKVLISPEKTIEVTRDKWNTYEYFNKDIPFPKSFIYKDEVDIDFPLIIKPRDGSGSRDVYKINNREEFDFYYKRIDNPIIQHYLVGKEYTIDCFADVDGRLLLSICRERIETKSGVSIKGKIIKNKNLSDIAKEITRHLHFIGPFFFQVKEDYDKTFKLLEINPRISGTMSLSSSSGVNLHSLAVRMLMGEKIMIPSIKPGLYISRYWEELFLTDHKKKSFFEIKNY